MTVTVKKRLLVGGVAIATLVIAAVLLVLWFGRTPPPSPQPEAESPIPTAPSEPVAPYPTLALNCGDLVSTQQLAGFFASPAQPGSVVDSALKTVGGIPTEYALDLVGGQSCYWRVEGFDQTYGGIDGYRDLTVQIRPHGKVQFDAFAAQFLQGKSLGAVDCDTTFRRCLFEGMVGEHWLGVNLEGYDEALGNSAPDAFAKLTSAISRNVEQAEELPAWEMPSEILALPNWQHCDTFVSAAQLQTATGVATPVASAPPSHPLPSRASTDGNPGVTNCAWVLGQDTDSGASPVLVVLHGLTGGTWAHADATTRASRDKDFQPIALSGLAAGDTADISCASEGGTCVINLVIQGSWINFRINSTAGFYGPKMFEKSPREAAGAVAEAIIKNLTSS